MRPLAIAVATSCLLVGCVGATTDPQPSPSEDGIEAPPVDTGLPSPDTPIPGTPEELADRLTLTTRSLRDAVEAWRKSGLTDGWPPPGDVALLALHQQRMYQVLAGERQLRRAVIRLLPTDVRDEARSLALAGARLATGAGRVTKTPRVETADPLPADVLRAHFDEAEARFGVGWELLAAINFIETRFGRVISPSSAGALGPMQFLPSTWRAYGLGGDVRDPRDAILGAANYLSASGAPQRERRALLAYNPVDAYADAVALYAQQMRRDPAVYYALYNWQVFVRTPDGATQLTGPGAEDEPSDQPG